MAKLQALLLVIAVCLVACGEAQQRQRAAQRLTRGRSRYLARQELAAPADVDAAAVTPYPSADELKPEVPFDEAAAAAPSAAEPTPDAVYGPPDAAPAPNNVPDEVYGPPDVTGNDLPAADVPAEQARLMAARRAAKLRRAQPVAYRRAVSAAARPAKLSAARRF